MNRLKDKRALVTGGTTGIGLETARQFLKEGARVAITGKNPRTLEAASKELGPDVLVIASDASDSTTQKQVANAVHEAFGNLDVLFINAGIVDMRPIEQFDPDADCTWYPGKCGESRPHLNSALRQAGFFG